MAAPSPSSLDAHLGFWLRLVSNHVSYAFKLKVERLGVTVAEWVAMRCLFDLGAVPPSRLADELGMTRGAISKLVERLCAKELVARTTDREDRRFQAVALTQAGRKLVPKLAALADVNDREFFGDLPPEHRAALAEILREIAANRGLSEIPVE